MTKEIDWSEAPEGATHYDTRFDLFCSANGYWNDSGLWVDDDNQNEWGAARYIERPTSWTGEGLPPVGTVCEFLSGGHWFEVEVKYSSEWLAVIKCLKNKAGSAIEQKDVELALDALDLGKKLRPLRTPEQIAAVEREKAIEEMAKILGVVACDDYVAATAIYDAGYRKQDAQK